MSNPILAIMRAFILRTISFAAFSLLLGLMFWLYLVFGWLSLPVGRFPQWLNGEWWPLDAAAHLPVALALISLAFSSVIIWLLCVWIGSCWKRQTTSNHHRGSRFDGGGE